MDETDTDTADATADAALREQEDAEDLRWLLSARAGRRLVYRQLEEAGVFRAVFSTDALAMAFAEGKRNAGLRLFTRVLTAQPDAYLLMVKENTDE